jgi:hypothetical protein
MTRVALVLFKVVSRSKSGSIILFPRSEAIRLIKDRLLPRPIASARRPPRKLGGAAAWCWPVMVLIYLVHVSYMQDRNFGILT